MSNLENLTSKIIEDAELKAENIIKEAKSKEVEIISKRVEAAKKAAATMTENANMEAKSMIDRALSKAELEVRNRKLFAKQQVMDKVFEEAEKRLSKVNLETFQEFVKTSILALDIDGDEKIIMSLDDKAKLPQDFLEKLNKALVSAGKKGNMEFSDETRNLNGGYILAKGGIEINNSFKSMISSLRDELEYGVNKILFDEN
ncbi:V-type ATP synthase subunit E [Clostridium tunisiense]|uniref:V-type ATP synthase subunit E n=1 Tax=Clostridium tunisiense TaxID=219748 RepID=UPI0002D392B2|nr:V-type ATP synthase subunit E [Clostridium tunisiense]